ncbi:MAG: CHAD domain-containing protein [Actinomycetota bacterium]
MTSPPASAAPRLTAGPAIQREESLGPGIKRICLEYLERACTALAHPDEGREAGIHTARKAMKRTRAMIRLTRDVVGETAFRNENAVLRDGARKIATARDRTVRLLTLERLLARHATSLPVGAFAALVDRLAAEREEAAGGAVATPEEIIDTITTLRTCRRRFAAWTVEGAGPGGVPDDFAVIAPGLRRVYRQGRSRMKAAYRLGTEAAFHRWRKSVKYLRHQLEALAPAWPEVLGALAGAADRLAETLGDEHDCAVLGEVVAADPGLLPDEAERCLLAALVVEEQDRLRRLARPLGERVYAEPPEAFVFRLGSYWRAWRR